MKFYFTQIYAEPGAAFHFSAEFLSLMVEELDALCLSFPKFEQRYSTFVVIITATRRSEKLEVKGPIYLRKRPEIEFALWVPFRQIDSPIERCIYVAKYVGAGVMELCNRYAAKTNAGVRRLDERLRVRLTNESIPLTFSDGMTHNNRFEFAHGVRPTRKCDALLLASQPGH